MGSEMCIRDSQAGPRCGPARTNQVTRTTGGSDAQDDVRLWRGTRCLLYTSDAADDLLCVDLGGRRIIKKKKKKDIYISIIMRH